MIRAMRKTTMEATPISGVRMRYTEDEKKSCPWSWKKAIGSKRESRNHQEKSRGRTFL